MGHIHEKIDFVVGAVIVHEQKVLMVFHKKLQKWLFVGGHVELDEDPEQALFREVKEECGLDIEVYGEKPESHSNEQRFLYAPTYLDIHKISDTHQHIGMFYFAKAKTDEVTLEEYAHEEIRWFTEAELDDPKYALQDELKFLAREALERLA